jgi:DNA-binding transcriptional regulator YiaG
MTGLSFKERLAQLGRVKDLPHVSFGSPEEVVLKRSLNADILVVDGVLALAKRGLSLIKARRAIDQLVETGRALLEVPMIESTEVFALEMRTAGIAVRFRSVEDRQLKEDFSVRLKDLRSRLGISQDEFAMRFSIDVKTLRGWEGGKSADRGNRRLISMIEKNPELADRLVNDD